MGYKNPTLTEILAELHLEAGTFSEKSFMAFARELAGGGLDDQELGHTAIVLGEVEGQDPRLVPRIRCWDRERIRLVQFSPDAIYVNLIGEFPGWDKFTEHIRATRVALANALKGDIEPVRIDLTTIDKWKVGREGFTIGKYLNCNGLFIPRWYCDVSVSSDIILGQGFHAKDGFNKKVTVKIRTSDTDAQFQISATFGVTDHDRGFDVLLNELHHETVVCFEDLITDVVRNEIMGGRR